MWRTDNSLQSDLFPSRLFFIFFFLYLCCYEIHIKCSAVFNVYPRSPFLRNFSSLLFFLNYKKSSFCVVCNAILLLLLLFKTVRTKLVDSSHRKEETLAFYNKSQKFKTFLMVTQDRVVFIKRSFQNNKEAKRERDREKKKIIL